jgi:hypothetical protein
VVSTAADDVESGEGDISPLIFGGVAFLMALGVYLMIYALNSAAMDRYSTGFIIRQCPVCEEGVLEIEERPYRSLGIPRARRTVRCDNCRSILREVGRRKWRYSVDRFANPELFETTNSSVLSEADLQALTRDIDNGAGKPLFLDDDSEP